MNTSTIKVIRALSLLIMAAAAVVSYSTQRTLFIGWSVDEFTAAIAPIAVDLLAIICTLAIHADGVARKGRRAAIVVLVLTGSGSLTANFLAGQTTGSRVVHAAMVALYLLAEWIAAQVKAPAAATTTTTSVPQPPAAVIPTAAPVSPGYGPVTAPTAATVQAVVEEDPAALAFRAAQVELRRTSKLPALNG
jgi:Protein of unknown function (DUF2637)